MTEHEPTAPSAPRRTGFLERVFELRMIIAILFAVYGVVCVIWGVAYTTSRDLERAAGINVNLTAGAGMLLLAIGFGLWALLSPGEEAASTAEPQAETDRDPRPQD